MIFHSLTFEKVPREVLKTEVFNTFRGTLWMLMNDKIIFDHYYCINSTKRLKDDFFPNFEEVGRHIGLGLSVCVLHLHSVKNRYTAAYLRQHNTLLCKGKCAGDFRWFCRRFENRGSRR